MEFGSEFNLGKKLYSELEIVNYYNGVFCFEMLCDYLCVIQYLFY